MKSILLFLFVVSSLCGSEVGLIPASYQGRFQPLENVPKEIELYIFPSHENPLNWLPLSALSKQSNLSLFSDDDWQNLKTSYDKEGLSHSFADAYFKAYIPLTKQTFELTSRTKVSFPSYGQLYTERFYKQVPLLALACISYLIAFLIFLTKKQRLALTFLISGLLLHTFALALRVYILERPPVSNMAETLLYVPWISVVMGAALTLILKNRLPMTMGALLGALLIGLMLFTFGNPTFENTQAVLNSRFWLIIHVLMVVASYGIFLLAGLLGHVYLILKMLNKQTYDLDNLIIRAIYLGVILLIPGTILGGVWAAQSWGRFWDWDPKESWAFISACFYLIVIHAHRFHKISGTGVAMGSVLGLMAITFTWYGVNYILGTGLHSYGFGKGGEWIYYIYLLGEALFLAFAYVKIQPSSARGKTP